MAVFTKRTPTKSTDAWTGNPLAAFEEYSTATFSLSWFDEVPKMTVQCVRIINVYIHKGKCNAFCRTS